MTKRTLILSIFAGLTNIPSYANDDIEKIEVSGTRTPLYSTRDVNASALGIKDVQLLPISVQSFSQALIEDQSVKTLAGILANDSSVQNTSIGTVFDFVSLRGFQLDWNNGLRRDGLALAPYQDVAIENIQRIDVIKGPSGIVSGFNNPGGTINYVTKRPTKTNFIDFSAQAKSRDGKHLHIDFGGPVNGTNSLGYRFNAAIEENGDFTGGDDLKRFFISGASDWQVNQDLLIRLDVDFHDKKTVSQPLIGLATDPNDHSRAILPPYVDTSEVLLGQPWAKYETQAFNLGARIDYWVSKNWQWVNQIAYSNNDRFTIFPDIYAVNLKGDVLSSNILVTPDEKYDTLSGHSFFTGQLRSWDINHELVVGVSFRDYNSRDSRWFELENPVGNIFKPIHTNKPQYPQYPEATKTNTKETSFFITDTLYINDKIYATLGLRHIKYKKQQTQPDSITQVLDDSVFNTPIIGINYNPSNELAFYASFTKGAGEGGVAVWGSGAHNEGEALGPQQSKQIEAGVKYFTSNMTYTLASFEVNKSLEYHNKITNYFVQDGEQVHKGIEFNASGNFTSNLSTVASISLLKPSLNKLVGDKTINGNIPANVPKKQANFYLDYTLPFYDQLSLNTGVFYVGERQQNVANSLQLPAYTRIDIGAKYKLSTLNTTLRLKVENLFSKEYWLSGGAKGIDWGVAPGAGRTIIASASFNY